MNRNPTTGTSAPADGDGSVEPRRTAFRPDCELREIRRGQKPGSRYVRMMTVSPRGFRRVAPGVLEATEEAHAPRGALSRLAASIRRVLVGQPLATAAQEHER